MEQIKISLPIYAQLCGGVGFHNNDATLYHIIDKEQFQRTVCKDYRELSPGFMRTFAGYDDWTREAMDEFAEYYEQMQKWTDTPMYLTAANGKPHFSDEEIETYCENVAERLDYLYHTKNVKHLRYYCFSNEMSCGMWGVLLKDLPRFKKYHTCLYRAFARHHLPIGLIATDASGYDAWSSIDYAAEEMADITEDYCVHIYETKHDIYDLSFYDFFHKKCSEVVDKAIRQFGKRVILGEMGISRVTGVPHYNGNVILDVCRYYEKPEEEAYCPLMQTEMVFAAINAGIFGIAFWTFIDHPDPFTCAYSTGDEYSRRWSEAEHFFSCTMDTKYNLWGFLKWDENSTPRAPYYCLGWAMKLFHRNAKVLQIDTRDELLRACGVMNRDGSVSVGIVNRAKTEKPIALDTALFSKPVRVYEYDSHHVPHNRFGDLPAPVAVLSAGQAEYTLKPDSVTYFTTDYLEKAAAVEAQEVQAANGRLTWKAVDDPGHCYYRVFAGKEQAVPADDAHQIASTVATSLSIADETLCYRVLSVDKSGNI